MDKANRGSRGAQRKLAALDSEYNMNKGEIDSKLARLRAKKSRAELHAEMVEVAHRMEMERLETMHAMEMEKMALSAKMSSCAESSVEIIACTSCGGRCLVGSRFCGTCGKGICLQQKQKI